MITVESHATSHVGRVRQGNEDNFLMLDVGNAKTWTGSQDPEDFVIESQNFDVSENGIILAVSDGMGGAAAGEVASKMAVETISNKFTNDDDPDTTLSPEDSNSSLVSRLYQATVYANHLIHDKGRTPEYQGMGATFTAVGITPDHVSLVQVGDSRTYLIRNKQIYQITKDQSLVQQLIDSQQIQPEEAETHSLKNVILQALGAQPEIYPVAAKLQPQLNDIFLICSDGLSNKFPNATEMNAIVQENLDSLEKAAAELVKQANERGGEDNITLVIARLTGDELTEGTEENIKLEMLDLGNIHDTADQNLEEF